jgi:predicted ABC-type ATPase
LPILTIVAGPNGCGKSTHSKELVADFGIECFDFNKEFQTIWSGFNFDPYIEQAALERAQKSYTNRRSEALNKKLNFAFETSYHTEQIFSVVEMFRSKRYHLEIIFICLESSDVAIERVKDRVAKGGLGVDEATIRKRFEDGLAMLDGSFHQFDLVSIYMSIQNDMKGVAIIEPQRKKAISISALPPTLISQLPKLSEFVRLNGQ